MKRLKKLTALLLVGILPLTLASCSSSDDSSDKESKSSVAEETQPAATEVPTEAETTTEAVTEAPTEAPTKPPVIPLDESNLHTFDVTSENLKDGVWDTVITNTENGENKSPQLSWSPVADATVYSVYMIDTSAGKWSHWVSPNVTETNLPQGWASDEEYIGPYPPSGTHDYEIYVFALREEPTEKINVSFNGRNGGFYTNIMALDKNANADSGNIISYGHIKGTYTYGE